MRKLVLGIALVIVLDIAFIWMMAMEEEVPEMAQAVIPNAAGPVIERKPSLRPVAVDHSEELDDRGPVSSPLIERPEPNLDPTSAAAKVRRSRTVKIRNASDDVKRLFPDKIIYIRKYEAPEAADPSPRVSPVSTSLRTELEITEPPRGARKRSFESRAFGVIKKPFNAIKKPFKWMGSLACKIGR